MIAIQCDPVRGVIERPLERREGHEDRLRVALGGVARAGARKVPITWK
jgi:hypothetical protein